MADKLEIYRGALQLLGNAAGLSSLTEINPARFRLDDIWAPSVNFLLTEGFWNFAIRTVSLSADEDVEAGFGYEYSFSKPPDWLRTASISDTGDFSKGFNGFEDINGYWTANVDTLYVRYISNDEEYGFNVAGWGQPFAQALEAYLAFKSGLPISSDRGTRNDMFSLYEKMKKKAKIIDAVDESVKRRPVGQLVRSRFSHSSGRDA